MAGQFDGKVALVTGAASGIGREVALAFGKQGAKVVVSDVAKEGSDETARLIHEAGSEATFVQCDVTQSKQVEALISKAVETYGRLDAAVNNAGIEGTLVTTADYPEEMWNRVLSVNLTGHWLCMKYEIPQMLKQGSGSIVNMASILGIVGFATASAYTAAKHGVLGITQVAALEYATQGIRVNAICPGFIETPMVMQRGIAVGTHPEAYQQLAALHPMKRLGKPREVAEAALWLCSDAASFVTGTALLVDGGYTAQ
jgi:NAD(P)-dependent dehydrogenase (short-subunit alcohol dehydrogenase family)